MRDEMQLLQGQGAALESLAQCMQLSWMCILVGPSGSGGSPFPTADTFRPL